MGDTGLMLLGLRRRPDRALIAHHLGRRLSRRVVALTSAAVVAVVPSAARIMLRLILLLVGVMMVGRMAVVLELRRVVRSRRGRRPVGLDRVGGGGYSRRLITVRGTL